MHEDERAKLRRNLGRAVVQTWMITTATVAVLIAAILVDCARGGELTDCEPQRVSGDGRHWAYRMVDGRQCWYPGERGKPKGELRWAEAASANVPEQAEVNGASPEPPPQQSSLVEQSKVEGNSEATLELATASPEPDTIHAMPEKWRAAVADQLLAFTCCWPELAEAVPSARAQPPTWALILLPLALCAMWSIRKLASKKKLRRLLTPDFGRSSVRHWRRWWQAPVRRSAQYVAGEPRPQQKGPVGGITSSSTKYAYRPTKLARIERALVPLAPHGLPLDSSRSSAKATGTVRDFDLDQALQMPLVTP